MSAPSHRVRTVVRHRPALFAGLTALLVAAGPVAAATTSSAGSVVGWRAVGGAALTEAAGPAGTGPAARLAVAGPDDQLVTRLAAPSRPAGVQGWIRAIGAAGAVATVTAGGRASAPLHLSEVWQRFGITAAQPDARGLLAVTAAPAAGTTWPAGTSLEVAGVAAASAVPSVTAKLAGTREVTLSVGGGVASAFNGRGFTYNPAAPGTPFYYSANLPQTCAADANLMGAAGVNLVAIPFEGNPLSANPADATSVQDIDQLRRCLDALWARGIGVAWLLQPTANSYQAGDAWTLEAEEELRLAATVVGSHPGTYLYLIGNELNATSKNPGNNSPRRCFFTAVDGPCGTPQTLSPNGQLDTLASFLKGLDPAHLIGTKLAGADATVLKAGDAPALDFWGVDSYPDRAFGTTLTNIKNDDPGRPALMTEFGNDRYDCVRPLIVTNPQNGARLGFACSYADSHEDSADQSLTNTALWRDPAGGDSILADGASAANPQGAVFGGTEFMYQDLWWFGFYCGGGATHDLCPAPFPSHGDGTMEIEWAGVTYAQQPTLAGNPRTTTPTFTNVAETWANGSAAFPDISGVSYAFGSPCTITFTWTTATAATSRVD